MPVDGRTEARKVKGAKTLRLKPTRSIGMAARSPSQSDLPLPEQSWQALEDATRLNGLHQTDSSRHQIGNLSDLHAQKGVLLASPAPGQATMRVAYFFSGPKRKASIAQCLAKLCKASGVGLRVFEIDICIGVRIMISSTWTLTRSGSTVLEPPILTSSFYRLHAVLGREQTGQTTSHRNLAETGSILGAIQTRQVRENVPRTAMRLSVSPYEQSSSSMQPRSGDIEYVAYWNTQRTWAEHTEAPLRASGSYQNFVRSEAPPTS